MDYPLGEKAATGVPWVIDLKILRIGRLRNGTEGTFVHFGK